MVISAYVDLFCLELGFLCAFLAHVFYLNKKATFLVNFYTYANLSPAISLWQFNFFGPCWPSSFFGKTILYIPHTTAGLSVVCHILLGFLGV